jgi:2-polyprenyl-3-methyl-5-hydroxy-6-metoxy-1,4-benzoquinol methylase
VEEQERLRRGSAFGAVADAYAEHRPDYPQAAVRWALEPAGHAVAGLRVLDLGAGTGKLTAVLTGLGAQVTAVEPDPAMLAQLRRIYPGTSSRTPWRAWSRSWARTPRSS